MSQTMLKGILAIGLIVGLVGCYPQDKSQTVEKPVTKASKIEALVRAYVEYDDFNGALLVAENGKVIYKNGFGLANREWDIPNQSDTKFRLASVTKQFTAMAMMQIVADGKADLNEPISTYLPDYPKENGNKITIHQLLTHTSGTPDYQFIDKERFSREETLQNIGGQELKFAPGARFDYSNSGYVVVTMIVEKITGKMFADVLKERIFDPLGMVNSGMDLHRPLIKNRASGYFKSWGKFFNANYIEMSTVNGAGGMYSTVEDMFLWDQALYTDTLLPKAYLDAIFEPYVADSDFGGDYGYGWEIGTHKVGSTSKTVNTVSHGGAIDGFCSKFTRVPATQSSIIFLSNNRRAFLNAMTKAILAIMNNEPYYLPKKSVVKAIIKSVKDQGVSQGVVTYKALKDSSDYYMSEEELVIFGYDFLFAGQIDEAITIFEIAIDAYPKAFNVYDSYAEALLASGNKELAIENYQKSIALNPENQNGIQKLKELGVNTDE